MTINKTVVYILTLLGTLGIVVMRTVQSLIMVERGSGFFIEGYSTVAAAMLIFMFAIIVIAAVYAFLYPKVPQKAPEKNGAIGIVSFLLAFAVIYEVLFTEISVNTPFWQVVLHLTLGAATTVIFFLHGISAFAKFRVPPMLNIIPVLFWIIKLIIIFSNYSSLAAITENVFELASLCAILVFILQFAKHQNDIAPQKTGRMLLPISVITFMLCGAYAIPQLILYFSGNKDLAHTSNVTFITSFAMMLFVGVYVYLSFKNDNLTEKTKIENEE